jgi:hypothetical protein
VWANTALPNKIKTREELMGANVGFHHKNSFCFYSKMQNLHYKNIPQGLFDIFKFLTILADDVAIFPFPNPPLSGVRRGWVKKSNKYHGF